jgi:hypothetical protein
MKAFRLTMLLVILSVALAACGAAASAPPSSGPAGGGGGVAPGQPGGDVPSFMPIADGEPTFVVPRPGTTVQTHDVGASHIAVALDGRRLYVRLAWVSGVEPCYTLDSVLLDRDGTNLHLTIREGTTDPNAACIEIAQLKATIVDLGEMEPGTYTISAFGDADPVTVEVR